MGLATALQTAAVVTVGDIEYRFSRLSIHDLGEVTGAIKSSRKAAAREAAKELGLLPHELYNVMAQIEMSDPTVGDVLDYAMTPAGAADLCKRALTKGGHADAADIVDQADNVGDLGR